MRPLCVLNLQLPNPTPCCADSDSGACVVAPVTVTEERKRRLKAPAALRTEAGSIVLVVEDGKDVGYQIGDDVVYFSDLPSDLAGHSDASVYAMQIGFAIGRQYSGSTALLDYIKNDLTDKIDSSSTVLRAEIKEQATAQTALAAKVDGVDAVVAKAAKDAAVQADALTAVVTAKNTELKKWVTTGAYGDLDASHHESHH